MASTSLGRLYVDLMMKTGSFETDAGRAAKIAKQRAQEIDRAFTGAMSSAGKSVLAFAGGLVAGFAVVDTASRAFFDSIAQADKLDELSARLGVSTEKLSGWGYAAKLTGSDLDQLAGALPKVSKLLAEAGDETSAAGKLFGKLGIEVEDAAGKLRDVEDVLPEIMDRFKALNDDTREQALAMDLFGKSGAEMLEFLNLGSEGLQTYESRAAALGIVLSGDVTGAAAKFNDQLDNLKAASQGFATQVSAALLPEMTKLVLAATEFVKEGDNAVVTARSIGSAFGFAVDGVTMAGDVFRTAGHSIAGLALQVQGLLDAYTGFATLDWSKMKSGMRELATGREVTARAMFLGTDLDGNSLVRYGQPAKDDRPVNAGARAGRQRRGGGAPMMMADPFVPRLGLGDDKEKPKGAARAAGLSAEAKAAQELQRAYEALNASQNERLAMLEEEIRTGDQASKLFQLNYDLENGQLAKLTPALKEVLRVGAEREDQMRAELELQREQDKASKVADEKYERTVAWLKEETAALSLSNLQLEIRNNLQTAGIMDPNSARGQEIADLTKNLDGLQQTTALMDEFRDIGYDALVQLPNDAAGAWKSFLDDLEAMITRFAAKKIMEQLFGAAGTNGQGTSGGDLLGSAMEWLNNSGQRSSSSGGTGGAGIDKWISAIGSWFGGGRANGGPVLGGKLYEVNEGGWPEMLRIQNKQMLMMPPGVSGMVTPMRGNAAGGRGGSVVIHQHINGRATRQTAEQAARESGRAASRGLRRTR